MNLEQLKYPVGPMQVDSNYSPELREQWIADIENFPILLEQEVSQLSKEQLDWRYRPEGWTIRQVVHHCADSHINSQMRFKLALTEDRPSIKPYEEAKWADLPDMTMDICVSLDLLEALHKRWVVLLRSLTAEQLKKEYFHPEHQKHFDLNFTIGMYSWHCRHHLAHVHQAIKHQGEFN